MGCEVGKVLALYRKRLRSDRGKKRQGSKSKCIWPLTKKVKNKIMATLHGGQGLIHLEESKTQTNNNLCLVANNRITR